VYDKDKFRLIFKSLNFKQDRKDPDIYIRSKAYFELRDDMVRYYIKGSDTPSHKATTTHAIEELYNALFKKFQDIIRGNKLDDLFGDC
jgi:hypothetical protein